MESSDIEQEENKSDAALAATNYEKIRPSTSEPIAPSSLRPEETTLQLQATVGLLQAMAREIVKSEFQQALQEMVKIEVAKLMAGIVTTAGTVVMMSQSTNALELVIIPTEEDRKDAPRVSITADMGELNQLFDNEDKSSPSSSLHEFADLNPLRVQQERQNQGQEQVRLGDKEPEYAPRVSEEGAALDAAVFSAPAQRQEETPSLKAEIASPPSPQEAAQSLPQSLAESADAAAQSCPAGGGTIEIFLISAKEFTLVSSNRMWNPGGSVTGHYYSGRVYDNVAHKEVQRWSYANLVM